MGSASPLGYRLRDRVAIRCGDPAPGGGESMTSKQAPPPQDQETPDREPAEAQTDRPLLDVSDAAVKSLIRTAKKRGYLTQEQINVLSKEVTSEQIEDVLARFSEIGVNVVETEETIEEDGGREEADAEETEVEGNDLVEVRPKVPAKSQAKEPIERTDDPVRMY